MVVPEVNLPLSRENLSQLDNEVDHLQEAITTESMFTFVLVHFCKDYYHDK